MTLPRIARSRAGFTLTELIVALVLMAIAAAVVLPSVGRSLNASKINQAATVVVSTLRESSTMAGRRRRPIRVSFDTVNKVIRLRDNVTPDSVFKTVWLNGSTELALSRMGGSDTSLVVFPNGLRTKPTATWPLRVQVQMGDDQREITMTRAGQTRIVTP